MTWTNGRCELSDGRVLEVWRFGRPAWMWRVLSVDGRELVHSERRYGCATEREAQVAAERAAGVYVELVVKHQAEWDAMRANADAPESFNATPPDGWVPPWLTPEGKEAELRAPLRVVTDPPQTPLEASVANTAAAGWATVEALRAEQKLAAVREALAGVDTESYRKACSSYDGGCDGNLLGHNHIESCPMFGVTRTPVRTIIVAIEKARKACE